jgi:Kef-type K+ transport system membrane component KefB
MTVFVIIVVLVALAIAGAWALSAVLVALLAGGVIHARDHRDTPYGGFVDARAAAQMAASSAPR